MLPGSTEWIKDAIILFPPAPLVESVNWICGSYKTFKPISN